MSFRFNPTTSELDLVNPSVWTVDTKANILASTPGSPKSGFATDTNELFVWDGTTWNQASLELSPITSAPDIGYEKNSDRLGYYDDAITDKYLYNTVLQGNARTENGAIRINVANTPNTFEIYLRGAWYTILYDFTTANVTYIGKARIKSSTSSAVWQIQKIDETTGMTITWADGDDSYDNIWGASGAVAGLTFS